MSEEKIIRMISNVLKQNTEISERLDKIENKVNILTKTSELTDKAIEIIKQRKYISKKELMSQMGVSFNNWRIWQDIQEKIENSKIDLHPGTGRAKTILISLNSLSSSVSIASRLFKQLNPKKPTDVDINYLINKFKIDNEKAKEVIDCIREIFGDRCKFSPQNKYLFKRAY
jgi:hypothetical protein